VARSLPFCNLTNFYFSISPTEYARNLLDEEWGCFKYVGMSWDMIMRMPIQDRRALISKHNREQEEVEREKNDIGNENVRRYEGSSLNDFARLEQTNLKKRS